MGHVALVTEDWISETSILSDWRRLQCQAMAPAGGLGDQKAMQQNSYALASG